MDVKEKLKDLGRHMIGQGGEVRFKNEVEKYAKSNRVSPEQAAKVVLFERFRNVRTELGMNGVIDAKSKDFKEFKAALKEVFGGDKLQQFTRDAVDPRFTARFAGLPKANVAEITRAHGYFSKNYKGRVPAVGVYKDSADKMKEIDALLQRFASDPRLQGRSSIENILVINPELGADLGKILETKNAVERHERMFDKDLKFEKAMEGFRETGIRSLTEMFWMAPSDYLTNIIKKGFQSKGLGGFVGAFFNETARFAGREAWAGAKLVTRSAYTAGSFVKNKIIR